MVKIAGCVSLASMCAVACTAIAGLEPLEFFEATDAHATSESGPSDASMDTAVTDGRVTDAAVDGDARVATGCTFVDAEFCDDFDHGQPLSVRWSSAVGPQGPCTLATSNTVSSSAPTSLRAESLSDDGGVPVFAALIKDFPKYDGNFFVSFDVLFKTAPTFGVFFFVSELAPTYGNNNNAVNPMFAAFSEDGGVRLSAFNLMPFQGTEGEPLVTVPLNQWEHVEASIRRDANGTTSTLRFAADGMVAPIVRQVPSEDASANPRVLLGINSGGTVVDVFWDNVVLETR